MKDSKIKFSVDGITSLHQAFQSILEDSRSLTEEWEKQGTSVVSSLKEQIELLKQRNQFGSPSDISGPKQEFKSENQFGSPSDKPKVEGEITAQSDTERIESLLDSAFHEGILINKVSLKELAAILSGVTLKAEPSKPEEGTTPQPGKEPQRETKEDENSKFLKSFVLASLIRPLNSNDPLRAGIDAGQNVGMSLMSMGGKAGAIGAILTGVTAIIGAKYSAIADVAPTAAEASRILGGDWASWTPVRAGQTQYGLRRNDVLQRQMQLARAMGRQNIDTQLDQALLWEQTTSLSASDIATFAQSARGSRGFDLSNSMATYFEMLRRSGVTQEKIETQMSEYLRELVTLNQSQLEEFGKSNTELNSAIYSAFASIFPDAAQNNPAYITNLVRDFYTGMSTATSDQISALQYMVASQTMNGQGSWYQARMMREDPFGMTEGLTEEQIAQRRLYGENLLKQYRSISGNTEDFAFLLEKQFGFNANQAYRIAQSYDQGTFSVRDFEREYQENKLQNETEAELRRQLPEKVDEISKMLAQWEALKIGTDVAGIRAIAQNIFDLLQGQEPTHGVVGAAHQTEKKAAETAKEAGGFFRFLRGMAINSNMQTTGLPLPY